MATFGEIINLQPYILNWLVNGDNADLAERKVSSEKLVGNGFKKVTYEGIYTDFLNRFLKPESLTTDVYPDRKPYFTNINKGKLLSSLIEYKRRWNINEDSATLKIDYVGFKGKYLVIKTTESITKPLPAAAFFNGTSSFLAIEPYDLSAAATFTSNADIELEVRATTDMGSSAQDSTLFFIQVIGPTYIILDGGVSKLNINAFGNTTISLTEDLFDSEWHSIKLSIPLSPAVTTKLTVDGNEYDTGIVGTGAPNWGSFWGATSYIHWGAGYVSPGVANNFYEGWLRNLKMTIQGTEFINIADPSTGTNTGTAADASVTDVITQ